MSAEIAHPSFKVFDSLILISIQCGHKLCCFSIDLSGSHAWVLSSDIYTDFISIQMAISIQVYGCVDFLIRYPMLVDYMRTLKGLVECELTIVIEIVFEESISELPFWNLRTSRIISCEPRILLIDPFCPGHDLAIGNRLINSSLRSIWLSVLESIPKLNHVTIVPHILLIFFCIDDSVLIEVTHAHLPIDILFVSVETGF